MKTIWSRLSLFNKLLATISLAILFVTLLQAVITYRGQVAQMNDQLGKRLEAIAVSVALAVDGDQHQLISAGLDESHPYVKELNTSLNEHCQAQQAAYVYTMALHNDKNYLIGDNEAITTEANFEEYEIDSETLALYQTGKAGFTSGTYTDKWGTFKSGYAPIHNSAGQLVGLVGNTSHTGSSTFHD